MRILHISDFHLDKEDKEDSINHIIEPLKKSLSKIQLDKPIDLILFTGDLVNIGGKNYSDITVILTLYKTPENKLKNLNQYKKYKTIFFDQESNGNLKNKIRYFFKGNFKYYSSPRNIGLSKASNFLLSKVKTRYCLFTQPDIKIYDTSILMLKKSMKLKTDVIFSAPKFVKKIKNSYNNKRLSLKIVNKVNAACMMCDVEKLKKIGFFDNLCFAIAVIISYSNFPNI